MPRGLSGKQSARLKRLKISSQRKAGMVRHANARSRSTKHNDEMIRQIAKGKRVPQAHEAAVKKVGL